MLQFVRQLPPDFDIEKAPRQARWRGQHKQAAAAYALALQTITDRVLQKRLRGIFTGERDQRRAIVRHLLCESVDIKRIFRQLRIGAAVDFA